MELVFAAIAESSDVTSDGKLTIVGIYDSIWVETFPATIGGLKIVSRWECSPVDFGMTRPFDLRLLDADGDLLGAAAIGLQIPRPTQSEHYLIADHTKEIDPFTLQAPDDYVFTIGVSDRQVARLPLHVRTR